MGKNDGNPPSRNQPADDEGQLMLTFSATILTDQCVNVTDRTAGPGLEVLLPTGAEFLPEVELRTDHHGPGSATIGRMTRAWRHGNTWMAEFEIDANTPIANEYERKILNHEIRHVSAGYLARPKDVMVMRPWSNVMVGGRNFASGGEVVDIITQFCVKEVSFADAPADESCSIFHVRQDSVETDFARSAAPKIVGVDRNQSGNQTEVGREVFTLDAPTPPTKPSSPSSRDVMRLTTR